MTHSWQECHLCLYPLCQWQQSTRESFQWLQNPFNTALIAAAAAAAAKSRQSCPTLCDPIDGSPPGSTVPGIPQARTLEWVAISLSLSALIADTIKKRVFRRTRQEHSESYLLILLQAPPFLSKKKQHSYPETLWFNERLVVLALKEWELPVSWDIKRSHVGEASRINTEVNTCKQIKC